MKRPKLRPIADKIPQVVKDKCLHIYKNNDGITLREILERVPEARQQSNIHKWIKRFENRSELTKWKRQYQDENIPADLKAGADLISGAILKGAEAEKLAKDTETISEPEAKAEPKKKTRKRLKMRKTKELINVSVTETAHIKRIAADKMLESGINIAEGITLGIREILSVFSDVKSDGDTIIQKLEEIKQTIKENTSKDEEINLEITIAVNSVLPAIRNFYPKAAMRLKAVDTLVKALDFVHKTETLHDFFKQAGQMLSDMFVALAEIDSENYIKFRKKYIELQPTMLEKFETFEQENE